MLKAVPEVLTDILPTAVPPRLHLISSPLPLALFRSWWSASTVAKILPPAVITAPYSLLDVAMLELKVPIKKVP